MPGSMLHALHMLLHLILTMKVEDKWQVILAIYS